MMGHARKTISLILCLVLLGLAFAVEFTHRHEQSAGELQLLAANVDAGEDGLARFLTKLCPACYFGLIFIAIEYPLFSYRASAPEQPLVCELHKLLLVAVRVTTNNRAPPALFL